VNGPPGELRLDLGCVLLAEAFKGGELAVDVLAGLDELAASVTDRTFDGLMAALFTERLRGNPFDYYDARNSFLDDVLLRGVGIPITLSVIAMEVGRRIGVGVDGIGLPGHFVVGDRSSCAYGDPFHGPGIHDRSSMLAVWRRLHRAAAATATEAMFDPVTNRQILLRMLNNLKGIYLTVGDQREVGALVRLRESFAELRDEVPDHARWLRHWN
jgi:regulator of sirC expression with transglutaminase-like and TPR domain